MFLKCSYINQNKNINKITFSKFDLAKQALDNYTKIQTEENLHNFSISISDFLNDSCFGFTEILSRIEILPSKISYQCTMVILEFIKDNKKYNLFEQYLTNLIKIIKFLHHLKEMKSQLASLFYEIWLDIIVEFSKQNEFIKLNSAIECITSLNPFCADYHEELSPLLNISMNLANHYTKALLNEFIDSHRLKNLLIKSPKIQKIENLNKFNSFNNLSDIPDSINDENYKDSVLENFISKHIWTMALGFLLFIIGILIYIFTN